jgi:hypothetical protein
MEPIGRPVPAFLLDTPEGRIEHAPDDNGHAESVEEAALQGKRTFKRGREPEKIIRENFFNGYRVILL